MARGCPEMAPGGIEILFSVLPLQIADPSPSGGRINIQMRRIECVL